ncbi:MAG: hypothetical protein Q9220_000929 [cf. Caloplaca sp. 1 TL-2023]
MTPQFYARYIPPTSSVSLKQNVVKELDASRPAKKRKKESSQVERSSGSLDRGSDYGSNDGEKETSSREYPNHQKLSLQSNGMYDKSLVDSDRRTPAKQEDHAKPRKDKTASGTRISNKDRSSPSQETSQLAVVSSAKEEDTNASKKVNRKRKKRKDPDAILTSEDEHSNNDNGAHNPAHREVEAGSHAKHIKVLSKYEKSIKATTNATTLDDAKEQPDEKSEQPSVTHDLVPFPQPPPVQDAAPPSMLSVLPMWMNAPVVASSSDTAAFQSLPLSESVQDVLKAKAFAEALAIQATVLPLLLPGEKQHQGDLCIAASTGSGKTLAYALPMIEALRDKSVTRLRGLVVVPTRELVNQAREVLETFSAGSKLKIGTAFGNKTLREEQELLVARTKRYDPRAYDEEQNKDVDEDEELLHWDIDQFDTLSLHEDSLVGYVDDYRSNVDILICTPGRLIEHLQNTHGFTLDHVQWLVIDEADRLLDESLQQWVAIVMPALEHQKPPDAYEMIMEQTFHFLRKRELRKVILSATMTNDMSKLKELKLVRPKLVVLQGEQIAKQSGLEADHRIEESMPGERIELPQMLQEIAVQVKDEENKPLHLIELLAEVLPSSAGGSSQQPERTLQDISSSDDDDASDGDSNSSASSLTSSGSSTTSSPVSASGSAMLLSSKKALRASAHKIHGVLIFTHSTSSTHRLSRLLSLLSPRTASRTATLTKSSGKSSKRTLSQFCEGKIDTIISTDRASRGLDIAGLAYVINYDMPPSVDSYIHRVGRTARAGKSGTAITLVGWREGRWFWNEVGRGQRIFRGDKKIARKSTREKDWEQEELERYADSLKQLGEETHVEKR